MSSIVLTAKGRQILNENTLNGGEVYWLGYYGLAYVPDNSNFQAESETLIGESEKGDYIYNLWQGDIVGSGYAIDAMSKLTLYDHNLLSNFRYSYNEDDGCNQLIAWSTDSSGDGGSIDAERISHIRNHYLTYTGVKLDPDTNDASTLPDNEPASQDTDVASGMPVPAPLFYVGGGHTYGDNTRTEEAMNSIMGDDWPTVSGTYPKVTPDMRIYTGDITLDSDAFVAEPPPGSNPDGYMSSVDTRIGAQDSKAEYLDQYGKLISVSNFNKAHGTVSSEGYGISGIEGCHNMSRVTKLFPIASYNVTATGEPETKNGNVTERGSAKAIKYHIDLNLTAANPALQACVDTLTYNPSAGSESNSFKFNRIGIYAVPAMIRHFYAEGDGNGDCRSTHYQVEISPDANPVLFAIATVEEVCMSENTSFGQNRYQMDFILNIDEPDKTGICTEANVYYNLVENEAITWYQNQLVATAGMSEAITSLQIDMAHMMNNRPNASCGECSFSDSTNNVVAPSYEVFNETYDGLVPKASEAGDTDKFLKGDGTWAVPVTRPTMPIIIRDVDLPLYEAGKRYAPDYNRARLTILKNGTFSDIHSNNDGSWGDTHRWDYGCIGSGYSHFTFGSSNQLIWYTWYKIRDYRGEKANPNNTLYLDVNNLVEGVVYEVLINLCAVGTLGSQGGLHIIDGGDNGFSIVFQRELDTPSSSPCRWYKWADVSAVEPVASDGRLRPNFKLYVAPTDAATHTPLYNGNGSQHGYTEPILASSTIHFVKVDGKIYVMSY